MHYYLWTIGCQMNFADSRQAAEELDELGYRQTDRPQDADLILLNTCVVRQNAEDKVVGRLTSLQGLKRRRPELKWPSWAALSTRSRPSNTAIPGWTPLSSHQTLPPSSTWPASRPLELAGLILSSPYPTPSSPLSRSACPSARAATTCAPTASSGCDAAQRSAVPSTRSWPRSKVWLPRGVKEITLLGQNVDSYGHDLAGADRQAASGHWHPDLADLLEAVHEVEGLARIRFLTSHPADMTDHLIETAARLPRGVRAHGGAGPVGRRHHLAAHGPGLHRRPVPRPGGPHPASHARRGPGHRRHRRLSRRDAKPSSRPPTACWRICASTWSTSPPTRRAPAPPPRHLPDDVPPEEKQRRRKAIDDLQERIVGEINAQFLDQTVEVLVEERYKGKWRGRTRTNKLVFFDVGDRDWTGQLAQVRIVRTGPWSMQGEIVRGKT